MKRPVTAKQIAAACGVSRPTVSRILAGGEKAALHNDATRQRVLDTAERLGYRPNIAARAINTGKLGQFALMIGTRPARRGAQPQLLDGLLDACDARDSHLLVVRGGLDRLENQDQPLPRVLREASCDGLVLDYTHEQPPRLVEAVRRLDVPVAWVNTRRRPSGDRRAPLPGHVVRPDDEGAAEAATRHLVELGHRRIAWIDRRAVGDRTHHYSHAARRLGWSRGLHAAGLPVDPSFAIDLRSPAGSVRHLDQVHRLLSRPDRPTAALTYSGDVASLLATVAETMGWKVPRDLSLLTFGDAVRSGGQPFDYMLVPHGDVGRRAIEQIAGDEPADSATEVRVPAMLRRVGTTTAHGDG